MSFVTTPIVSDRDLYFPWGVHEAKSGLVGKHTQAAYYVYVQVACGVAICMDILIWLSMIHDPAGDATEVDQELEADSSKGNIPPMIAFTSVGPIWDIFICYKYANKTVCSAMHSGPVVERKIVTCYQIVSRVWTGNITKHNDAFKLLHIVDEARAWALDTFRPWVIEKLEICHKQLAPLLRTLEKANKRKVAPSPKPEKTQSMKPKKTQSTASEKIQSPKPKKTQSSKPKKTPHSNSHPRKEGSKTKALADRKDPSSDTNPHPEMEGSKTEVAIDSKEQPFLVIRSRSESKCLETEVVIDSKEGPSVETKFHPERQGSKTEVTIGSKEASSIVTNSRPERGSSKPQAAIDRKEDPSFEIDENSLSKPSPRDSELRANYLPPRNMVPNKELCCGYHKASGYWQFAWMWILIALIHSLLYGGFVGGMQSGAGISLEYTTYPTQHATKLSIAHHPELTRERGLWRPTEEAMEGGDVCCGHDTGSLNLDGTPPLYHRKFSTHDFVSAALFFETQARVPPDAGVQPLVNKSWRPGKRGFEELRRRLVTFRVLSPPFGMLRRKESLAIPSYAPLQELEHRFPVATRLHYPILSEYISKGTCTITDRSGFADHTPSFRSHLPITLYDIQPDNSRNRAGQASLAMSASPHTMSGDFGICQAGADISGHFGVARQCRPTSALVSPTVPRNPP
jgi:hypothetical protein